VEPEPGPAVGRMLLCSALLMAIFLFAVAGLTPPSPKPADVPPDQFSASRALTVLKILMPGDLPHPVGSAANAAVRERILAEFRRIGYQIEVQTAFECNPDGTCATVNNILARLDAAGGAPGEFRRSSTNSQSTSANQGAGAVLLAAHYDSVPAGPGISDDGVGAAAVLEIARAWKSRPSPSHSIIFLVDDGEEVGLLGARAFVNRHPWAKEIRAAVNLDARGTSGPSLMFETGRANDWAVRLFARSVAHPVTSSIFYTAYQQLPNDTDFTVFKDAGFEGFNFAFIGDVVHYHTQLDNLANVNPASLQHQGDNALDSLGALANADFSDLPPGEAVYFDVFQQSTVHFAAKWAPVLAILNLGLLIFIIARLFRERRLNRQEFFWGLLAFATIAAATGLLALVLLRLMRLAGALSVNWTAHPAPVQLAFWSLAISVAITQAILYGRRAGFWGFWAGVWTWWAVLSLAIAWKPTGIVYVFVIPAAIASLAALPLAFGVKPERLETVEGIARILPPVTVAIISFAPILLLYDGLGNRALPFIALVVAVVFTSGVPLFFDLISVSGMRGLLFFWTPIVVTIVASLLSIAVPGSSAKAPERMNLEYWKDADTGKSQWIVQPASGRLPESIGVAAMFEHADKGPFPWDPSAAFLAAAPGVGVAAPTFTILQSMREGNRQVYRALLRSERGAPEALALFPPGDDAEMVKMNDEPIENGSTRLRRSLGGWSIYRCLTMTPEGVQLSFTLPVGKSLTIFAVDASYGLPPEGRFLVKARPPTATPSQEGDVTIVSRHVLLNP
jgi:hypothetical protein